MKDRYDLRCVGCGQFIGFDDPDAHCKEIRTMDVLGNVDERDECLCGRCVRVDRVRSADRAYAEAAARMRAELD